MHESSLDRSCHLLAGLSPDMTDPDTGSRGGGAFSVKNIHTMLLSEHHEVLRPLNPAHTSPKPGHPSNHLPYACLRFLKTTAETGVEVEGVYIA